MQKKGNNCIRAGDDSDRRAMTAEFISDAGSAPRNSSRPQLISPQGGGVMGHAARGVACERH